MKISSSLLLLSLLLIVCYISQCTNATSSDITHSQRQQQQQRQQQHEQKIDDSFTAVVTVHYPLSDVGEGVSMYIRGDRGGLNWNQGSLLQSDSTLTLFTTTLTLSTHDIGQVISMKAILNDDENYWQLGANSMFNIHAPNTNNSYTQIFHVYPWFFSQQGEYVYERQIYSEELNNTRDLVIYLPPSYFENTLIPFYSTLIMHDGQNLFNESTSFAGAWLCQDTVNALVISQMMREIIIVGVDNTDDRTDEYTYSIDPTVGAGGLGDKYLDFLEKVVLNYVSKRYRISTQRDQLGILGSSLGGLISCYAGWTRSSVYSKIGCMSSSFWWNNQDFNNTILNLRPIPKDTIFYLDSGDSGPDNDDETQTKTVLSTMNGLGFINNSTLFYYLDHGGQHNEKYWGDRFWSPMLSLFPLVIEP